MSQLDIRSSPALSASSTASLTLTLNIYSSPRPPSPAMFCKVTLVALALALVASASPTDAAHAPRRIQRGGFPVPLAKRGTLTNSNGVFNRTKAVNEITKLT